jgi:hypothetical protein
MGFVGQAFFSFSGVWSANLQTVELLIEKELEICFVALPLSPSRWKLAKVPVIQQPTRFRCRYWH